MKNHHQYLLDQLSKIDQLSKSSKLSRFFHAPLRYFYLQFYKFIIYPWFKKAVLKKIRTFWGSEMTLLIPAGADIFLLGAKTHDSEIRLSKFLIQQLQPNDLFIDAGAHFGFYSMLAAHVMENKGNIFSFDASQQIFSVLNKNVSDIQSIAANHFALCSSNLGQIEFNEFPILFSEYNTIDSTHFEQQKWFKNIKPQKIKVQGTRLDSFLNNNFFNDKKLSSDAKMIIKIDVEGAEYEVIKGLTDILTDNQFNHPIIIVIEYWGNAKIDSAQNAAVELLKELGFHSYVIDNDGNLKNLVDFTMISDSENIVFKR